jgi:predicted metal-dependent HD superfamily phosphohydrolase
MEKETLEEAADRHIHGDKRKNFIRGANWQAERMYSEEEVIELLEYTRENFYDTGTKWHEEPYKDLTSKELLEQFKKK